MESFKQDKNIREKDEVFFEKAFLDEENKCIHLPVKFPKIKGASSNDVETDTFSLFNRIKLDFEKDGLFLTGEEIFKKDDKVEEFIYPFERK